MKIIKKSISLEPLKSRLPNYLNYINEEGVIEDKFEGITSNSWGKIMPNIILPDNITVEHEMDNVYGGKSYGYRRLMDLYYTILKDTKWDKNEQYKDFAFFIEKLNGIQRIDKSLFPKSYDIPFIIHTTHLKEYIEELKDIKNEITLLKKKELDSLTIVEKKRLYHTAKRYKRKGGDKFIEYLEALPSAEDIYTLSNRYIDRENLPNITFDIYIGCSENDMGYSELLSPKWVSGRKYYNGDIVLYQGDSYICTCEIGEHTTGLYNQKTGLIEFDYDNFTLIKEIPSLINSKSYIGNIHTETPITFKSKTHSQIRLVRFYKSWISPDGIRQEPRTSNEEWLSLYKVGVVDYNATKDKYDNIEHFGFDYTNGNDLILYGSGIKSIELDEEEGTITIDYYINQHLIADFLKVETDNNGKELYYFHNFRLDNNITEYSKHSNGSSFQEKFYITSDSDLDKLINNKLDGLTFDKVINDTSFKSPYKFEMFNVNDGNTVIKTHTKGIKTDYLYGNLIKREEAIGISNQPKIQEYTDVDRGVTNYAESHIALGDVYSFEDLVNYNNGGFFKIEKT